MTNADMTDMANHLAGGKDQFSRCIQYPFWHNGWHYKFGNYWLDPIPMSGNLKVDSKIISGSGWTLREGDILKRWPEAGLSYYFYQLLE